MTKNQKPRRAAPLVKKGIRPSPVTAAELLLEIGVEELPYQFIAPALAAFKDSAEQLFKDQRLAFQSVRTLGTPRRLTLVAKRGFSPKPMISAFCTTRSGLCQDAAA